MRRRRSPPRSTRPLDTGRTPRWLSRQIDGDRHAADAALRTLIDKHAEIAAFNVADVYALRDDANETFEWLDRAWALLAWWRGSQCELGELHNSQIRHLELRSECR